MKNLKIASIFLALFAACVQADTETPQSEMGASDEELAMRTSASIRALFEVDTKRKEYWFRLPTVDRALQPWQDLRTRLNNDHGFRPNISATHVYQKAEDTIGSEDDVSGYELVVDGTWTFWGLNTGNAATAGFEFLYRDYSSDIPPVGLFTQVGSLYPTTVAFSDVDPTIGQFWIQKKWNNRFGIQGGKLFPLAVYDYFPLKNFRTDFMDAIHAANFVIPLPDRGLGSYIMYRPTPETEHYIRVGVHDANADAEEFDFDVFDDGELFTIIEFGWDPGITPQMPGRPPLGDIHLSFWQQDERKHDGVAEAWGLVLSAYQKFGRYLPFVRYGYADSDEELGLKDAVPIEHMVNAGIAIDGLFGKQDDRLGIGATWSRPIDDSLDDQGVLDLYYRFQVTPRLAITPTAHLIFDPVRNSDEDQVLVWGVRSRFAF